MARIGSGLFAYSVTLYQLDTIDGETANYKRVGGFKKQENHSINYGVFVGFNEFDKIRSKQTPTKDESVGENLQLKIDKLIEALKEISKMNKLEPFRHPHEIAKKALKEAGVK